jgi:cytochrome c-type biogenesis protein CcmH
VVTSFLSKRLFRVVVLSGALLSVFATDGDQARFNNLGHQMICMCGCNQILLECNHVGCTYSDRMRNQLTAGLARGDSDTQVQQWFVQEYGLTVLAAPLNRGFGRVAWVTPFAVFLGALLIATLVIRNWRQRPIAVESNQGALASRELTTYRDQARRETEI